MKKVKIEGYLERHGAGLLLNSGGCVACYIASDKDLCPEGAKIYEAFHDFKGKRKKVTITVEG